MKYQEQMNGVAQQAIQQLPPEQQQNPSVIEMVMAQAAQQVMNANQAMGMAQSPEQQLVSLEQAKVELQKQKLQSDTAYKLLRWNLRISNLSLMRMNRSLTCLSQVLLTTLRKKKLI